MKVCKAQHIVDINHELAQVLFNRKEKGEHPSTNAERRRKLARMEALRQTQGADPPLLSVSQLTEQVPVTLSANRGMANANFRSWFVIFVCLSFCLLLLQTVRKEKEARSRDLKTIELYRKENKQEGIVSMLNQAITTEHAIHPSMGATEFFEFELKNPYNVEHTIVVECTDPELL